MFRDTMKPVAFLEGLVQGSLELGQLAIYLRLWELGKVHLSHDCFHTRCR